MSEGLPPLGARNVRRKPPVSIPPDSSAEDVAARSIPAVAPAKPSTQSPIVRWLWSLAGVVMVVAIGGTVAWGARHYVKTSPRFAVTDVSVSGAKRRTADELSSTAGIAKGQNVFSVDLDKAQERLLGDPWIAQASLARQLPGTLLLQVVEREAAGIVTSGPETYLVTREGVIIKRIEAGDPSDLHVVTGIAQSELMDDREGATRTIRKALDLAFDYDHSSLASHSPLQEVHVEQNGEMTLTIGKSAVALHMGAGPYRKKLDQAVRVLAELDRRGAKPDAIMLDNEAREGRVVVRMR